MKKSTSTISCSTQSKISLILTIFFILFSSISIVHAEMVEPSMSTFGSIDSTGYVNLFTGDLNVPITLMTVPGTNGLDFPIKISYSPGISPKTKASIVGLGWNFDNPGITRTVVGYPDDAYGVVDGNTVRANYLRKISTFLDVEPDPSCPSYNYDPSNQIQSLSQSVAISTGAQLALYAMNIPTPVSIVAMGVVSLFSGIFSISKQDTPKPCTYGERSVNINDESWNQIPGYFFKDYEYSQNSQYQEMQLDSHQPDLYSISGNVLAGTYIPSKISDSWSEVAFFPLKSTGKYDYADLTWNGGAEDYNNMPLTMFANLQTSGSSRAIKNIVVKDADGQTYVYVPISWIQQSFSIKSLNKHSGDTLQGADCNFDTLYERGLDNEPVTLNYGLRYILSPDMNFDIISSNVINRNIEDPMLYTWTLESNDPAEIQGSWIELIYEDNPFTNARAEYITSPEFKFSKSTLDSLIQNWDDESITPDFCELTPDGRTQMTVSKVKSKRLAKIKTPTHEADLKYSDESGITREDGREPIVAAEGNNPLQSYYLKNIELKSLLSATHPIQEKIEFNYDYSLMPGAVDNLANNAHGRLTLKNINVFGTGLNYDEANKINPGYEFSYSLNEPYNPDRWDNWGYYCADCTELNHDKTKPITPQDAENAGMKIAYSLSRINWPTGAATYFFLEPDRYQQALFNEFGIQTGSVDSYEGGLRVQAIRSCPTSTDFNSGCVQKMYEYEGGAISSRPGKYNSESNIQTGSFSKKYNYYSTVREILGENNNYGYTQIEYSTGDDEIDDISGEGIGGSRVNSYTPPNTWATSGYYFGFSADRIYFANSDGHGNPLTEVGSCENYWFGPVDFGVSMYQVSCKPVASIPEGPISGTAYYPELTDVGLYVDWQAGENPQITYYDSESHDQVSLQEAMDRLNVNSISQTGFISGGMSGDYVICFLYNQGEGNYLYEFKNPEEFTYFNNAKIYIPESDQETGILTRTSGECSGEWQQNPECTRVKPLRVAGTLYTPQIGANNFIVYDDNAVRQTYTFFRESTHGFYNPGEDYNAFNFLRGKPEFTISSSNRADKCPSFDFAKNEDFTRLKNDNGLNDVLRGQIKSVKVFNSNDDLVSESTYDYVYESGQHIEQLGEYIVNSIWPKLIRTKIKKDGVATVVDYEYWSNSPTLLKSAQKSNGLTTQKNVVHYSGVGDNIQSSLVARHILNKPVEELTLIDNNNNNQYERKRYFYDDFGRLSEKYSCKSFGAGTSCPPYSEANADKYIRETMISDYSVHGIPKRIYDAKGNYIKNWFGASGNVEGYCNDDGEILRHVLPTCTQKFDSSGNPVPGWSVADYDDYGRIIKIQDVSNIDDFTGDVNSPQPIGPSEYYWYDYAGRLVKKFSPSDAIGTSFDVNTLSRAEAETIAGTGYVYVYPETGAGTSHFSPYLNWNNQPLYSEDNLLYTESRKKIEPNQDIGISADGSIKKSQPAGVAISRNFFDGLGRSVQTQQRFNDNLVVPGGNMDYFNGNIADDWVEIYANEPQEYYSSTDSVSGSAQGITVEYSAARTAYPGLRSKMIPVKPNTPYVISAKVKGAVTSGYFAIAVHVWNKDETGWENYEEISTWTDRSLSTTTNGNWVTLKQAIITSDVADQLDIYLFYVEGSDGDVKIDDVKVDEGFTMTNIPGGYLAGTGIVCGWNPMCVWNLDNIFNWMVSGNVKYEDYTGQVIRRYNPMYSSESYAIGQGTYKPESLYEDDAYSKIEYRNNPLGEVANVYQPDYNTGFMSSSRITSFDYNENQGTVRTAQSGGNGNTIVYQRTQDNQNSDEDTYYNEYVNGVFSEGTTSWTDEPLYNSVAIKDKFENQIAYIDALGCLWKNTYDKLNRLRESYYPLRNDASSRKCTLMQSASTPTIKKGYDASGRLTYFEHIDTGIKCNYLYDDNGNLVYNLETQLNGGTYKITGHDSLNRPIVRAHKSNSGSTCQVTYSYPSGNQYAYPMHTIFNDAASQLVIDQLTFYDGDDIISGNADGLWGCIDENGVVVNPVEGNAVGKMCAVVKGTNLAGFASGTAQSLDYGSSLPTKDNLYYFRQYGYDESGRLVVEKIGIRDQVASSSTWNIYLINYNYDSAGNILEESVRKLSGSGTVPSKTIHYRYDQVGRIISIWLGELDIYGESFNQDNSAAQKVADNFEYTGSGQLKRFDLANGIVNKFTYDARGRIIERSANKNILVDGGFENAQITSWTGVYTGNAQMTISRSTSQHLSGSASMQISVSNHNAPDTWPGVISEYIAVKPNTQYTITAKVKGTVTGEFYLTQHTQNIHGTSGLAVNAHTHCAPCDGAWSARSISGTINDWQTLTTTFTTGPDAFFTRVLLIFNSPSSQGTVYVDEVQLVQGSAAPAYSDSIFDEILTYDNLNNIITLQKQDYSDRTVKSASFIYDQNSRMTRINNDNGMFVNVVNGVETPLFGNLRFNYDMKSSRISKTAFNAANQQQWTESYAYTATPTPGIGSRLDYITSSVDGMHDYTFDGSGNLVAKTGVSAIAYDQDGMMISYNNGQETYLYDDVGQRIVKKKNLDKSIYVYDAKGRNILDVFLSGKVVTKKPIPENEPIYDIGNHDIVGIKPIEDASESGEFLPPGDGTIFDPLITPEEVSSEVQNEIVSADRTREVGSISVVPVNKITMNIFSGTDKISELTGSTVNFFTADHLKSVTSVTNSVGSVMHDIGYVPFGEVLGVTNGYTEYTGKDRDFSGLYYYGARYYDPSIGIFTTADSIELSPNPYSYVKNNPLKYVDPDGKQTDSGIDGSQADLLEQMFDLQMNRQTNRPQLITGYLVERVTIKITPPLLDKVPKVFRSYIGATVQKVVTTGPGFVVTQHKYAMPKWKMHYVVSERRYQDAQGNTQVIVSDGFVSDEIKLTKFEEFQFEMQKQPFVKGSVDVELDSWVPTAPPQPQQSLGSLLTESWQYFKTLFSDPAPQPPPQTDASTP